MSLDIIAEVAKLNQIYKDKRGAERYHALIYGDKGSGKTSVLATARYPVFVDSFDPGGTLVLRDEIEKGVVVVDCRWEEEDITNPKVFVEWDKEFHRRKKEGFFDIFATYAIDSLTTLSQRIMDYVLKKAGRPGGVPQTGTGSDNDYVNQMLYLENSITGMFRTSCDLILTAHPDADKDETTGKMFVGPLITGKAKTRIPLSFSEMYYAKAEDTKDGTHYSLQTKLSSTFKASSRLGKGGKFNKFEEPNIKALLKKAGLPYEDMPIPWLKA